VEKGNGLLNSSPHHSFFKTLIEQEVTVELKNDIQVRGTLKSVDQYLNIKLDDISVVNELLYPHLVRASSYPRPPSFLPFRYEVQELGEEAIKGVSRLPGKLRARVKRSITQATCVPVLDEDISLTTAQSSVKNVFIRGSVVRYVHLPPDAVDIPLLEDATRRGKSENQIPFPRFLLAPSRNGSAPSALSRVVNAPICRSCRAAAGQGEVKRAVGLVWEEK
jgi:small nuclear ribonucleoprotein (snRNP)-like protein